MNVNPSAEISGLNLAPPNPSPGGQPPRDLVLVQLVSEQTMPNLLPVLRLKPSRLVHLATPRTRDRSLWIAEAARQAGCPITVETTTLSAMPGMQETMKAVLAAIEHAGKAEQQVVVNFTCGTKLMSIGAFVAALRHKTPSFYVDTQDAKFVDGQSAPGLEALFDGDLSFTPLMRSLTVHVVAAAHGVERVTGGEDWRRWLPLARHLAEHPEDEAECHRVINGEDGRNGLVQTSRLADCLEALDRDLPLPSKVCELALEAGLYRPGSAPHTLRLPDSTRLQLEQLARGGPVPDRFGRLARATAPVQRAANFLGGGWWEVIVAAHMAEAGLFRDVRWSVQVGERGGANLEEDVVALDGVRVVYVSCKRSSQGSRLFSTLEHIKARADHLGGIFNRRILAIWDPPYGRVRRNLETRARRLGIELLFGRERLSGNLFLRGKESVTA